MLLPRPTFMKLSPDTVKYRNRRAKTLLMLSLMAMASAVTPNANASDSNLVEKTITVKFSASELKTPAGLEAVYTKLQKRARSACQADRYSLRHLGQTMTECQSDLMDQFIKSSGRIRLTQYHKRVVYEATLFNKSGI